jgi:hypothetical protein
LGRSHKDALSASADPIANSRIFQSDKRLMAKPNYKYLPCTPSCSTCFATENIPFLSADISSLAPDHAEASAVICGFWSNTRAELM